MAMMALVVLLLVCCVGFASSAEASKFVHRLVADGPGVGKGQFSFGSTADVAVNRSSVADGSLDPLGESVDGYMYLADEDSHRVDVFSADGEFQFVWGRGVLDGGVGAQVCVRTDASCTGGLSGAVGGTFNKPQGIAIDQDTGHVFVLERPSSFGGNARIQEFEADGTFVRAWGFDVALPAAVPESSAVFETCLVAAQCKAGVRGAGVGQLGDSDAGLAVDQASGDVLVADAGNRRIQRFTVPANPADPIPAPTIIGSAAEFSNGQPTRIAVDDGIVYASDNTGFTNRIVRYNLGTVSFMTPIEVAALTGSLANAATVGLEVDPVSGSLFVARDRFLGVVGGVQQRFSPVFELGNPSAANAANVTHADTHVGGTNFTWGGIGLDPDSGDLYIGGAGPGSNNTRLFAANDGPAPAPVVTFLPAANVSATGATLSATIDPNGQLPVSYEFQVATSSDPGDFKTVGSGQVAAGAPAVVTAVVSDLRPKTAYLVRIVTTKQLGNPNNALDGPVLLTKAAAPSMLAVGADSIDATSARLRGRIDPNGTGTRYRFDYGAGGFFQHSIPVPDGSVGSGYGFRFVSEQLTGLQPATTYQYRLVATSDDQALGTTPSPTKTFTTLGAPDQDVRAFEIVSPPDKFGGQGVGFWPNDLGHMASAGAAAHEGERFMALGWYGSVLSGDNAFGLNSEWVAAERVDNVRGWESNPLLTHPEYKPSVGKTAEIMAASDDFSSIFWGGAPTIAMFPEMVEPNPDPAQPQWHEFDAGWLSDWGGPSGGPTRWELFGPRGLSATEIVKRSELPFPTGFLWRVRFSSDGSDAFAVTKSRGAPTGLPVVHGLAGPDDPTLPSNGDLVSGRSIYHADLTGGLADTFAGTGARELVNVCTGTAGVDRTQVPAVVGGDLSGQECPAGNGGRQALVSDHGAAFSLGVRTPEMVSEDGSRVFFLSPDPNAVGVPNGTSQSCTGSGAATLCAPQLYVRQRNGDGSLVTRWLSKAEDGLFGTQDSTLTGSVRFEGMSKDGSVVFFRTNSPLTIDDPNGTGAPVPGGVKTGTPHANSWDLYRLELADGPDPTGPGSTLTRVSSGPNGNGDCNSPRASVDDANAGIGLDSDAAAALRFVSNDGVKAYFTCQAPLPAVTAPADATRVTSPGGTPTTTDQTNLYLYDANLPQAQRWRFIARLPRATGLVFPISLATCATTGVERRTPFSGADGYHPSISGPVASSNCVSGTAGGEFITLFTPGRLTADDQADGVADIYGYDSDSDELVRITAPQNGEGAPYPCRGDDPLTAADERLGYSCRGDGGVSSGQVDALGVAVVPLVGGDRVAFFQSASRLVPDDLDGGYDVYEWRNGKLSLVTSGAPDSLDALYKGNDRTGRDVYVVTRDRLSWQDTDAVADVYTARVGGGIAEPVPAPVCAVLAGACQAGGGAGSVADAPVTDASGSGNADAGERAALSILAVGSKARKRAALTGRLAVRVRATAAGKVSVVARGRVAKRNRVLAKGSKAVRGPGVATVALRLTPAARSALRKGHALRLSVWVRQPGARGRSIAVLLERGDRR